MKHKIQPIILPNGRFANNSHEESHGFMLSSLAMYCYSMLKNGFKRHPFPTVESKPAVLDADSLNVQWLGHATFLIQSLSLTIITDPVFGNLTWLFKRIQPFGIALDALPRIDAILLSHNHRDHADVFSLKLILQQNPDVAVHCASGDGAWLRSLGFVQVYEYTWWQSGFLTNKNQPIRLTFLPTKHWSQRGLFDKNASLWGSFMIHHAGKNIYFGGDSAYGQHYRSIAQEFPVIDLALLPIAPCEPHAWISHSHMNAQQAGISWLELGARAMIPMHWGTFHFGIDHPMLSLERLQEWYHALAQDVKNDHRLVSLFPGQSMTMRLTSFENNLYSNTRVQNQQTT